MKLAPACLGTLIWVAIYSGLFAASVGYAVQRGGANWGWNLVAAGIAAVVAGAVMIWIRSRIADPPGP